ncbi:MAG: glycosyltransferase family 4 protein [Desulfobacterales bacterium]|nr:glycosyltransferase family 4 protein [Desulfobacterales bacterium]
MKKILLISNRVMHYRITVYNYFARRFKEHGWEFIVRADQLQEQNTHPLEFDFKEVDFKFSKYKKEIENINPDVVIIFLHLKDIMIWPLLHWLKYKKTPIAFWTKGANLDAPDDKLSYLMYRYMHSIFDGLILYSKNEIKYIDEKNRHKVSVANNTINFEDFPEINESKEQIKNEFGIPFEKVVLSVGRMGVDGGRKKIHHLIEIFNDIDIKGVGLVIVGSGMSSDLLNKINKNNTIYLGEIHDPRHIQISKLFKMADLFSVPGHVGLGLNQAFYWGLPVVTEEGLQPPEIYYLINGRNGYIVPENDLNELKKKILFLLENNDVRKEFSESAKDDILKTASVDNMFMGFKNCIESLQKVKTPFSSG